MLRLPAARALSTAVSTSLASSTPCSRTTLRAQQQHLRRLRPVAGCNAHAVQQVRLFTAQDQDGNLVGALNPNVPDTPAQPIARSPEHAISNPTLANIEKRWPEMPPQEQAELWMALRDRMTNDWHTLTMQEKKTAYWIAFGPHGPRSQGPPDQAWQVFKWTSIYVLASIAVFITIRSFARDPPKTMTKEWQEMSNEYLKAQKSEAITGISAPGYQGKGMIQSKPGLAKYEKEDE